MNRPHPEVPIDKIRRLSRELVEALDDFIDERPGEKWVIHIRPSMPDGQSIMLASVDEYHEPDWDFAFPVKSREARSITQENEPVRMVGGDRNG